MPESIEPALLARSASSAGLRLESWYAESSRIFRFEAHEKVQHAWLGSRAGCCVCARSGEVERLFFTDDVTTEGISALLEGRPPRRPRLGRITGARSAVLADTPGDPQAEIRAVLVDMHLSLLNDVSGLHGVGLAYAQEEISFVSTHPDAEPRSGVDFRGELTARWYTETGGRRLLHSLGRFGLSAQSLIEQTRDGGDLKRAIKRSLRTDPPWPCPEGEVPLLWHPRALTTLLIPFLRAFEGDTMSGSGSWLRHADWPQPMAFSVVQDGAPGSVDHEGTERHAVTLFADGHPRAALCDRLTARKLGVEPTGNCRRAAWNGPAVPAPWRIRLQGHAACDDTARELQWGIAIHDADLIEWNPRERRTVLRVTDSNLIHQGTEGEGVEPFLVAGDLLGILGKLVGFTARVAPIGVPLTKQGQELVAEFLLPTAISAPVPLSGRVPMKNYW